MHVDELPPLDVVEQRKVLNIRWEAVDHHPFQTPRVIEDFSRCRPVERFPWHVTRHHLQEPKWDISWPSPASCEPPNQPDAQVDVSPTSQQAPNSALPASMGAEQKNVRAERFHQGVATTHASEGGAPNKKLAGEDAIRTAGEWET
nr:hypothetical protein [Burkholderia stabilis]